MCSVDAHIRYMSSVTVSVEVNNEIREVTGDGLCLRPIRCGFLPETRTTSGHVDAASLPVGDASARRVRRHLGDHARPRGAVQSAAKQPSVLRYLQKGGP